MFLPMIAMLRRSESVGGKCLRGHNLSEFIHKGAQRGVGKGEGPNDQPADRDISLGAFTHFISICHSLIVWAVGNSNAARWSYLLDRLSYKITAGAGPTPFVLVDASTKHHAPVVRGCTMLRMPWTVIELSARATRLIAAALELTLQSPL